MLMALPGCLAPKHNPEVVANSTFEKFPSIVARQKLPTKDIEKETSNSTNDLDKASDIQLVKMESQLPLPDRKSTRLNSSHIPLSRIPSSA